MTIAEFLNRVGDMSVWWLLALWVLRRSSISESDVRSAVRDVLRETREGK